MLKHLNSWLSQMNMNYLLRQEFSHIFNWLMYCSSCAFSLCVCVCVLPTEQYILRGLSTHSSLFSLALSTHHIIVWAHRFCSHTAVGLEFIYIFIWKFAQRKWLKAFRRMYLILEFMFHAFIHAKILWATTKLFEKSQRCVSLTHNFDTHTHTDTDTFKHQRKKYLISNFLDYKWLKSFSMSFSYASLLPVHNVHNHKSTRFRFFNYN